MREIDRERESDRRMKSQSPPKHRHDGTSPSPLGMDWSPPSKNRNGEEAVGLHCTGWSYSVTEVHPKSKDSDPDVVNSICVELRSPEGITKTRCILKKLPDFMKLITDLEKKFPEKIELRKLETRCRPIKEKCNLGKEMEELLSDIEGSLRLQVPSIKKEWITQLLSDIDISRSFEVVSFLELEAAVSAFHSEDQDVNQQNSEANSQEMPTRSNLPTIPGSSSIKPDYGSDTAYENAEPGTPWIRKDENSEIDVNVVGKDVHVGSASETSLLSGNGMDRFSEPPSDVSCLRGSKLSNFVIPNLSGDGSIGRLGGAEASSSMDILGNLDSCGLGDAQLFQPLDMVKTEMKYLEARREQETTVRTYHEAKIKEIEVEQEIDRQKIEALNQALTTEKEYNISLRWEMDELRQTALKIQSELEEKSEKEKHLLRELSSIQEKYEKKKADCKVLVGEVKHLRQELQKLEKKKSEAEKLLQQVKLNIKQAEDANKEPQHQSEHVYQTGFQLTERCPVCLQEGRKYTAFNCGHIVCKDCASYLSECLTCD